MRTDTVLAGKRVLVTGGTGSLGQALVRRMLSGELGRPRKVVVFSRDEAKQHDMRTAWARRAAATDDATYVDYRSALEFRIGDVRDYDAVAAEVRRAEVVFHAAALKQVPQCEYSPLEAVKTNVLGAANVVRAILSDDSKVSTAVAVSTDKACKPINVMGMTKALQERIFVTANLGQVRTRFMCVRYGNVIASRGSVVPLFIDQIRSGAPVTLTDERMTRFLLTLDRAIDTIFAAVVNGEAGDTYVPKVPAASVRDVARVLIGSRTNPITITGIRPGEKLHEILVSEEEAARTIERGEYYVIRPILPEMTEGERLEVALHSEYSSRNVSLSVDEVKRLLLDAEIGAGRAGVQD